MIAIGQSKWTEIKVGTTYIKLTRIWQKLSDYKEIQLMELLLYVDLLANTRRQLTSQLT